MAFESWLSILPPAVFGLLCVGGIYAYYFRKKSIRPLIRATLYFRIAYAGLLTVLQYFVWAREGIGTLFLNVPLGASVPVPLVRALPFLFDNPFGYFIMYSWGHFWFQAILSFFAAWVFYKFLILLRRREERFFDEGETELGFLAGLIAGWPLILVFIPLAFIAVVAISVVRLILFKETHTTLGVPLLLGVVATLMWGSALVELLNLGVLRI